MRKLSRGDITLMLLGSSRRLSYRKNLKIKLRTHGYKSVIIMEDIKSKNKNPDYGGLDEKFAWIVSKEKPNLFIAIFHKNQRNDGIIFEIGWLCGKYGITKIKNKLRFIFEKGYNIESERMTAYLSELFSKIPRVEFNDSTKYNSCVDQIRKFVSNRDSFS